MFTANNRKNLWMSPMFLSGQTKIRKNVKYQHVLGFVCAARICLATRGRNVHSVLPQEGSLKCVIRE